ncbi:MAG: ABC transporter permease [Gemmatimonadaceae bacterium]|nr:ABC transporter permease [Gemmatimonadaceae bacterium]
MTRSPVRQVLLALATLLASLLVVALLLPAGTLLSGAGAGGLLTAFLDREVLQAIGLTLLSATIATALAVAGGIPVAYLLARVPFRGRAVLEALLELPLVIPHPVIGMALLLALGRGSPLGATLAPRGLSVVNSPVGIVVAMLVVSAPLFILGARESIARVDPRLEAVARTLGDDRLRAVQRVTLPIARNGIVTAATAMWARATSEFGAIVLVAYHPRVASVLAYDRYVTYGLRAALPVAAALVCVALGVLLVVRLSRRMERA